MVLPFWCRLPQVVLEKRPLNGCSVVVSMPYSQSAQAWITQFYLKITPCLPFLRKRSPDGATTTEVANIQLQLTTH